MKRIDLSAEQLDRVISLRKAGSSWLGIEDSTGISRRVAQRAYTQWDRARSAEELKTARREVAKGEFERHLDALTWMADRLVDYISVPQSPSITVDAETYLSKFYEADIPGLLTSGEQQDRSDREIARSVRRSKMLLNSLQEHTRDKVSWESLAEWKQAWDYLKGLAPELREVVDKALRDGIRTVPGLIDQMEEGSTQENALGIMVSPVGKAVWRGIVTGNRDDASTLFEIRPDMEGSGEVMRLEYAGDLVLKLKERDLAEKIVNVCRGVVESIWSHDIVNKIETEVRRMEGAAQELETGLDPLVLRPMILRTRCELCPV